MVRVHPCLPSTDVQSATNPSHSRHEPGHRHASRWIRSRRARRARRCSTSPKAISPRLAKAALAGIVDGQLVDLTFPLAEGRAGQDRHRQDAPEALPLYRHSTAHLLAAAVTNLFPGVQCGIGPATDEGFFYDFVVPRPFVPEDLDAIEQKMRELAAQDLVYERQMWPRDEAKAFFAGAASR